MTFAATIPVDLESPISIYRKLEELEPSFLLESAGRNTTRSRYSYIGLGSTQRHIVREQHDLAAFLRRELEELTRRKASQKGFSDGLIGVIAYEAAHDFLPTGIHARSKGTLPLAAFVKPKALLVFDHVSHRLSVIDCENRTEASSGRLAKHISRLLKESDNESFRAGTYDDAEASMSYDEFEASVVRAKDYIACGDVFQVVVSIAFEGTTDLHPFDVYRSLRSLNPSPYLFFHDFGDFQVLGSSPEALVRLKDDQITLCPIAGTRKRGNDQQQDIDLEKDLIGDQKENAEHNMLVDLARNDVGRVSRVGSVRVERLREIEHYSHVMHLVSQVCGERDDKATQLDVLRSAFPAGTLSGAPKIRALQIIDELEPCPRGFYGGAAGYFSASGDMDQAIIIRSMVMQDGRYTIQAGAGIVADSDPQHEYQEILNKSAAMRQALELAANTLAGV